MAQRRAVLFSGDVQGVGFRATTCRLAAGRPLTGYVRNLPDGRVELVTEGEPAFIDALIRDLHDHFGDMIDESASTTEPATGEFADPIVALPGVYGTHHIGASTAQAQEAIAAETVRIIRSFKDTGRVPNVVNLARRTPATHMLVVRHRDRPGVLAHVFDHLREANLNVQETENIVFSDAKAAIARINVDGEPPDDLVTRMRAANPGILDVQVVPLGSAFASHQLAKSLSNW